MPIGTGDEPLEGGVQRHWPLRRGDRVMHPDYRDEAPRAELLEDGPFRGFPAYQDPPIVGTVIYVFPERGFARVQLSGVGVRDLPIGELKRCEL